jgi:hypothetical protein
VEGTSATRNNPLYLTDPSKGEGGIAAEIFEIIISFLDAKGKEVALRVNKYWKEITINQISTKEALLVKQTIRFFIDSIDAVKYSEVKKKLENLIEGNPVLGSVSLIQIKENRDKAVDLFLKELFKLKQQDLMKLLEDFFDRVKGPSSFSIILSLYREFIGILNIPDDEKLGYDEELRKMPRILYELAQNRSSLIAHLLRRTPIEKQLFLIDLFEREFSRITKEEVPSELKIKVTGGQPRISKLVAVHYDHALVSCLEQLVENGIDGGKIEKFVEIINKYSFKTEEIYKVFLTLVCVIEIKYQGISAELIDTVKDEKIKMCLRGK